ncbi:uncharacterized protein LOC143769817 isoform X4 [Ranitomeya variabilis]|uniref:uncharacterized protein LOC143769817 isoform X4 n=1 Tax=Ranitomeya variabilis TaxID=490064 RepID=UPI0040577FC1
MNNDEQTDDSGGEIQVAKGPLLTSCPCDQMMSAEGAGSLSLSSPDTRKSRCSVAAEVAERWHGHRGAAGWSEGLCAQRSVSRGLCRASTAVLRPADAIPSPVISSAAMISPQCRLLHKDSHNLEAIRLLGICYLCREGNIYESHRFLHKDSHNLEAIRLSGICYLCREGNIYELTLFVVDGTCTYTPSRIIFVWSTGLIFLYGVSTWLSSHLITFERHYVH